MYSKALAVLIRKIGDRTHRTRYRELERLIREAYRSIRESGVSLRVQDRVWLRLCCVSWVGAWLVRWPLRKINKMTKKEQQPNGPLAKAEALGVKEKVLFLGQMGDVSRWYQAMDCFVMPSLFEGLPVVGIEAQAAGLPCVFSDRVTDEVLITPHACRVSLEEGTGTWAEAILSMSENTDRAEGATLVREAGYDIRTESARLEKRYLELGS